MARPLMFWVPVSTGRQPNGFGTQLCTAQNRVVFLRTLTSAKLIAGYVPEQAADKRFTKSGVILLTGPRLRRHQEGTQQRIVGSERADSYMKHVQPFLRRLRGIRNLPFWWTGLGLSVFSLLVTLSFANPADAATYDVNPHLTAEVGFNGYFVKNHWVPVRVQMVNGGPSVLQGQLAVHIDFSVGNGRFAQGTMHWPVSIAGHHTASMDISVPGNIIDDSSLSFLVDGQPVAATKLTGNALGDTALVTVLSANPQAAQFLTGTTFGPGGAPVLPVSIKPSGMPATANGYSALTAVVATPGSLDELSNAQTQALKNWVELGGLLLVESTNGIPKSWQSLMPLTAKAPHTVSGARLNDMLDITSTPLSQHITSYAGKMRPQAQLWAGTPANPLLAATPEGRGQIVQTAFLPTEPAVLGWSNNLAFWTRIIKQGSSGNNGALPSLLDSNGVLSLAAASGALTPLRIPSLKFWGFVFAIYTLVAGPGLFFLLRRRKRETLAWVILPSLSILTTFGIYALGAQQRPGGMLTEGVGVLDLAGNGLAESYGIRAFMSPYVASTTFIAAQPMLTLPLAEQNVRQLGVADVTTGARSVSMFEDVGRFGVRYLYSAGAVQHQGRIATDLLALGSTPSSFAGNVTNDTPYPLQHVVVYWNQAMFVLGNLAPGATASITPQTPTQVVPVNWLSTYSGYNREVTRGLGRPLGNLANSLGFFNDNIPLSQAIIIATTNSDTPALPKPISGQTIASAQSLVMVRQMAFVAQYPHEVGKP